MINKNEVKINDLVYIVSPHDDHIFGGRVEIILNDCISIMVYEYYDSYGNYSGKCNCQYKAKSENIFINIEKAVEEIKKNHSAVVESYCNEIVDIESMIKFSMNHCLNGEEYTDWDAVKAYQIRAKELFNVDLNII